MRFVAWFVACTALLSACGGPSLSPEQKVQRAANIPKTDAALKTAQDVQIDGKMLRVATIADKSYALVELQGAIEEVPARPVQFPNYPQSGQTYLSFSSAHGFQGVGDTKARSIIRSPNSAARICLHAA
ncbi:hypothetical protein K3757_08710 [Sulfitobacter sp. S223]|uniref:hypothetical protein n=1 Tax=Sulfitobacter sp. S223 TaxID=2867023 RepID=UPI0021A6F21B|nr:hypothetical protein [Sulfitobacter sp. S223]UWR27998.1 hypothetical protein K3757_08710 [Sulfitobacter sp. S223]